MNIRPCAIALVAAVPIVLQAASIQQKTSGFCSPAVANVAGNVTIVCNGVSPRALSRLNAELSRKKLALDQKIAQAEEWAAKYRDVKQRLEVEGDQSALASKARQLLNDGDLDGAEAVLKEIQTREEAHVARFAQTSFELGLVADLKFEPRNAALEYKKAYRAQENNAAYGVAFADALYRSHQTVAAEKTYLEVRDLLQGRKPPSEDDQRILVTLLNGLGLLYRDENRMDESEKMYRGAIDVVVPLAQKDGIKYSSIGLWTINNLAGFYRATGRTALAEKDMLMALDLENSLVEQLPNRFESEKAQTLANLGTLCHSLGRLKEAEAYLNAAYEIRSRISNNQSDWERQRALGQLLYSRAGLYASTNRDTEAEKDLEKARDTQRPLAEKSLEYYGPAYADTLNKLAVFYRKDRLELAEQTYVELAKVYQGLTAIDAKKYRPEFARTIYNLSGIYGIQKHWDQCAKACDLLHTLYAQLWKEDPATYGDQLALASLMTVDVMKQVNGSRSRACSLLQEAKDVAVNEQKKQQAEQLRKALACPD